MPPPLDSETLSVVFSAVDITIGDDRGATARGRNAFAGARDVPRNALAPAQSINEIRTRIVNTSRTCSRGASLGSQMPRRAAECQLRQCFSALWDIIK